MKINQVFIFFDTTYNLLVIQTNPMTSIDKLVKLYDDSWDPDIPINIYRYIQNTSGLSFWAAAQIVLMS